VLARLKHPHVVQLLGCSEKPPAIVLERAEHGGMDRLLKAAKGRIPLSCQIEFMHQISAGMVYLHSNNILHRDLSEQERFLMLFLTFQT
jgi:serine/threonine protein kinase